MTATVLDRKAQNAVAALPNRALQQTVAGGRAFGPPSGARS